MDQNAAALEIKGSARTPSTRIVRAAGLAAWAIIGIQMLIAPHAPVYRAIPYERAVVYILHLAFGIAFWFNTRRIQGRSPSRWSVALLVLQGVIAILTSSDLLLLVALETPLILTGRPTLLWMMAQVVASVGRLAAAAATGTFEPIPDIMHLPQPWLTIVAGAWMVVWELLAFAGGHLAASQYRGAQKLARVNAELLATQQLLADSSRLAERLHISRELHDALGHHLAALSLSLELAALRANGAAAEPVREAREVARQLLTDVRDTVSGLRQDRLIDLRRALETLVAGTGEPQVHLTLPEQLEVADPYQAQAMFRCVQEAITNAIRHAGASHLWIEVRREGPRLELSVRDDGQGVAEPRPGHGLTGMRERFANAGGGLEISSTPGLGFELHAWLPAAGEPT